MTTRQRISRLEKRLAILEGLPTVPRFTGLTEGQKSKTDIIKQTVCKFYDLHPDSLDCRIRTTRVVWARHVAMKLCRDLMNLNDSEVGRCFKRSPWNTFPAVSHVVNKIRYSERLRLQYLECEKSVKEAIA